jgi:hypothetical protein
LKFIIFISCRRFFAFWDRSRDLAISDSCT